MKPLTDEQKARGGNGDIGLWMEIEAERERDPSEYRQTVAPEHQGKLNQAAILNYESKPMQYYHVQMVWKSGHIDSMTIKCRT